MNILKELVWIRKSRQDLKKLPNDVQDEIGYALHQVQAGGFPDSAKPLKGLPGVYEIRTDFDTNTYRAIYATKIGSYIYILHVFKKKSKTGVKTSKEDIDLIKSRLQDAKRHSRGET